MRGGLGGPVVKTGWMPFKLGQENHFAMIVQNVSLAPVFLEGQSS